MNKENFCNKLFCHHRAKQNNNRTLYKQKIALTWLVIFRSGTGSTGQSCVKNAPHVPTFPRGWVVGVTSALV
jgi:hypothetical protein